MAKEKKTQTSTNKKKTVNEKKKNMKIETVDKNKKSKVLDKKDLESKKEDLKANKELQIEAVSKQKEKKLEEKVKEVSVKEKMQKEKKANTRQNTSKGNNSPIVGSDEMDKLIKIVLVLVVICAIFYGLTIIITKFQKTSVPDRTKETTPAVIQYDEILIGTMLNQVRDEYYVLIQKDDDQYQSLTSYYLQKYKTKQNAWKVYTVNMNSVFNQFHVAETSNLRPTNIGEFKVSQVTFVKIKNHQIEEVYEGMDEVENKLKELIK